MPGSDPAAELARIFKILSVDTRVRIVQMLRERPLCVNALATRLGVSHSAVSQHLRILWEAGLVSPEKRGYWVHYSLDDETMGAWSDVIEGFLSQPKNE